MEENKATKQQRIVNVELQQQVVGQLIGGVEHQQNDAEIHEENVEHQEDNVEQEEIEPKRQNELEIIFQDESVEEERMKETILEKYVRRHHAPDKIIGDKESRFLTMKRLKSDTCLLCEFEPK